ncbi:MAG TPA: hypothetical protein PLC19_02910 [Marmoricola sp.]|nr:hypothetical protein [Marmoricola sp.]HNO38846.1 hypothetical protein [Marmoricola sp.]
MQDFLLGGAAIAVGLLFCFYGAWALRIVITIWGAFVGFAVGAGLVAAIWDQGFLSQATGWFVGFGFALVFAALAYLYYAIAVLLATGSLGFAIGTAVMGAIGINWNWLVILVSVLVGIVVGVAAIMADLPHLLLVVLSSMGGASVTLTGLLLVIGKVDSADFADPKVTVDVPHDWWWYAIYFALTIAGIVSQSRARRWEEEQWRRAAH